jgi:hypothetical protein
MKYIPINHCHDLKKWRQEYTALMASIEEIQVLMEAEVAGGCLEIPQWNAKPEI